VWQAYPTAPRVYSSCTTRLHGGIRFCSDWWGHDLKRGFNGDASVDMVGYKISLPLQGRKGEGWGAWL
jgi:hypothetical protein